MKKLILTILALSPALSAHAAEEISGMPHPKLLLLIGANLAISGVLMFLLLVLASAFWDRRKARKRVEFIARRRAGRVHSQRGVRRKAAAAVRVSG